MEPKILKNETEYEAALEQAAALMSARAGTPEADALDLWSFLIEDYESRHHPVGLPEPIEAIRFRMDQQGLRPRDLEAYLGSKSKVSEVLNRKRPLSLAMIRRLHAGLGIPAEVLLQAAPRPALHES
ncbi:MAG: transcriptional regulator [Candidatus Hydrogenedens sp.]|nr:transcriptional regulator [Candidatus Hydrogenedens sp.]